MSIFGSGSTLRQPGTSSVGNGCAAIPATLKTSGPTLSRGPASPKRAGESSGPRRPAGRAAAEPVLKLPQHRVGAGAFDLARLLLDIQRLDHAVVHQHRIPFRAGAEPVLGEVELEPERTGKIAAAVGQHAHLALGPLFLAPRRHDKDVVDRNTDDFVDSLGFDVGRLVDVAGQVALRAGRGERAGHGEEGNLLAAEEFGRSDVLRPLRGHLLERRRWYLVANLDGHWRIPQVVFGGGAITHEPWLGKLRWPCACAPLFERESATKGCVKMYSHRRAKRVTGGRLRCEAGLCH